MFRLIGHLPFSYFVAHFSFSLFFFASHNTYKRTGMTNVNDILEKKRREETISRPLFLPLFSYLQPSSVYLIVFCSYTENVVIFFCNGWPTIFFSWTETPLLSLFLSLSCCCDHRHVCMFVLARKVP